MVKKLKQSKTNWYFLTYTREESTNERLEPVINLLKKKLLKWSLKAHEIIVVKEKGKDGINPHLHMVIKFKRYLKNSDVRITYLQSVYKKLEKDLQNQPELSISEKELNEKSIGGNCKRADNYKTLISRYLMKEEDYEIIFEQNIKHEDYKQYTDIWNIENPDKDPANFKFKFITAKRLMEFIATKFLDSDEYETFDSYTYTKIVFSIIQQDYNIEPFIKSRLLTMFKYLEKKFSDIGEDKLLIKLHYEIFRFDLEEEREEVLEEWCDKTIIAVTKNRLTLHNKVPMPDYSGEIREDKDYHNMINDKYYNTIFTKDLPEKLNHIKK